MRLFVTCAKGTEGALADELAELGIERRRPRVGGVEFAGRAEDAWWVCLTSRIAGRVLLPLSEFPCRGERDLYDGARAIDWQRVLDPSRTLAVSAVGSAPGLEHTLFVAQRTKDAIVDRLRDETGARPSVSRDDPDVAVFVRLFRGRATVSLDLAGESLHRRGFRERAGPAPLKETLAAALLRMSGWDRARPLVDPMCGSGTLAIEADLWARAVAPGLARKRFGFERWADFGHAERRRLERLREKARARERQQGPQIVAFDADPRAVELARSSAVRAGARIQIRHGSVSELVGTEPPGWVIFNPPYGERMAATEDLYREIERVTARLPPGHRVALLLGPRVAFRPPDHARIFPVYNGALECRFASWDVGGGRTRPAR